MKHAICLLPLLVIVTMLLCQCADMPPLPIEIPDVLRFDSILKKEPAITTSLDDAVTELPFLDDFDPQDFTPMVMLPRDSKNVFILRPGLFEMNAESYCLHAGKYVPSEGKGYVYAPLKGPYAHIVQSILQNSVDHPEIPQRDIQVLIWAVIARTKITEMPGKMQQTAAQLLEPEEILELNGGALSLIPDALLQQAMAHLPPQVRQVMEAEARLRQMLTTTQATYEELEQIAAPFGDPPPGEGSRDIPGKRWAYHPDGFFIRYFPSGYSRTLVQMSVPERFYIERDTLGRITLILDWDGNRIETEYDDAIEPVTMADDPDIRGYAFRSIRFVKRAASSEAVSWVKAEWNNSGWTFVGAPSGNGQVGSPSDRFNDLQKRYAWARSHKKEVQQLDNFFEVKESLDDIMDLGHYALAINQVLNNDRAEKAEWTAEHPALIKKAWQYAVCMREGGCDAAEDESVAESPVMLLASVGPPMYLLAKGSPEEGAEIPLKTYDPSENVAAPGNTSRQRLAQSGRSTDPDDRKEQVDPESPSPLEPIPIPIPECGEPEHLQCLERTKVEKNECSILFAALVDTARDKQKACMELTAGQSEFDFTFQGCNDDFDQEMLDALDAKRKCMEEIGQCKCTR